MYKQIFSFLVLIGLFVNHAFAMANNTPVTEQSTDKMLKKMTLQTQQLEHQMKILQQQIKQLKARQDRRVIIRKVVKTVPVTHQITSTQNNEATEPNLTNTRISIAPFLGKHTGFNAFDLITNYSSYNEDLALLHLRDRIYRNEPHMLLPALMLSGGIEGDIGYHKPYQGENSSKVNLSRAELDITPIINSWVNGFMAISYDDNSLHQERAIRNSRLYIDRAFVTVGNLDRFPVYMSVGQLDVPFGRYSHNFISTPLTERIFKTKARALVFGYDEANGEGIYGQIFGFAGNAETHHTNNINNLGANVGLKFHYPTWNLDTGISTITDIANANTMQETYASGDTFKGFSQTISPITDKVDVLRHQVHGVSVHFNGGIGHFGLHSEYITATNRFAHQDMTFNGSPARPQALHIEGDYSFPIFNKASGISIAFDKSWEALALAVPERRFALNFSTQIWKDTIQQLEFTRAENYGSHDSASGAGVNIPRSDIGGYRNTIIAKMGIYF